MYSDCKEVINTNNLQIYKPYSYKYFADKYQMRYDSMFKNYRRKLHNKYDYFITFPMVSEKPFYIKGNFDDTLQYLKDNFSNRIEYIEINNCNAKDYYKDVYKYCYFKNISDEFLCEEYRSQYGRILYCNPKKNIIWDKHFFDEVEKRFIYRRSEDDILFWRNNYEIVYNFMNKKWKVYKWNADNVRKDVDFSMQEKEFIEKIIKRMGNKKYNGFYDDDIKMIKDLI